MQKSKAAKIKNNWETGSYCEMHIHSTDFCRKNGYLDTSQDKYFHDIVGNNPLEL